MATVTNDDGTPDLYSSIKDKPRFHQKSKNAYDQQKIRRIRAKQEQSKDTEKSERSVTRSSIEKHDIGASFCAICGELDEKTNLHAAGTLHASRKKDDTSYNVDLTSRWKSMPIKVGNDRLLNLGHCNVAE